MTKDKKIEEDVNEESKLENDQESEASVEELSEADELTMQLEELAQKASENLDGWQRSQAEFSNYKKRVARDQTQMHEDLKGRIIKRYLEVMDDLERALENKPLDDEGAEWAKGIELVYRKLASYIEGEGVTLMEIKDGLFDPNFHEAIAQEESEDHESGEIIEILQPGYLLGERILRPAVVKVAQ
jgi:molecular chaperone GrpE